MTPELTALGLALLLHIALLCLFALRANLELGTAYTSGPRDTTPRRPLSPVTGRLQRAVQNSLESLILFAPAVGLVTLSGTASALTATCAMVFVVMRLLYIPAYAFALCPWRSLIWALGFLATLTLILTALLG